MKWIIVLSTVVKYCFNNQIIQNNSYNQYPWRISGIQRAHEPLVGKDWARPATLELGQSINKALSHAKIRNSQPVGWVLLMGHE